MKDIKSMKNLLEYDISITIEEIMKVEIINQVNSNFIIAKLDRKLVAPHLTTLFSFDQKAPACCPW